MTAPASPGRRGRASAGLAAALAAAVTACAGAGPRAPDLPRGPVALRLPALDGGEVDLARYRGRVVVLHLFTTWSLAAQLDVAELTAAHRRHADQVAVIGVGLDPDGYPLVAPWRDANRVPYLVALATPAVRDGRSPLGRVVEAPTTVILGRDGAMVRRIRGPLGEGRLEPMLAAALRR